MGPIKIKNLNKEPTGQSPVPHTLTSFTFLPISQVGWAFQFFCIHCSLMLLGVHIAFSLSSAFPKIVHPLQTSFTPAYVYYLPGTIKLTYIYHYFYLQPLILKELVFSLIFSTFTFQSLAQYYSLNSLCPTRFFPSLPRFILLATLVLLFILLDPHAQKCMTSSKFKPVSSPLIQSPTIASLPSLFSPSTNHVLTSLLSAQEERFLLAFCFPVSFPCSSLFFLHTQPISKNLQNPISNPKAWLASKILLKLLSIITQIFAFSNLDKNKISQTEAKRGTKYDFVRSTIYDQY